MFFGEQSSVSTKEPHDDLRFVFFGADLELQFCQLDHARVPGAHDARLLRLRPLFGNVAGEAFEVTGLKVVGGLAPRSAVAIAAASTIAAVAAPAATTISIPIAATSPSAAGRPVGTRSGRSRLLNRGRDRPLIHLG